MTVAQRGYSVVIPPMGSFVRQGSIRLSYPSRRRAWMTAAIGELDPSDKPWHRSTDRAKPTLAGWGILTRCGVGLYFATEDPRDDPEWSRLGGFPAVRRVLEVAEFPAGRVCSRCQ
jgi:hypothetical protein